MNNGGIARYLQRCMDKAVEKGFETNSQDPDKLTDREAGAALVGHMNHLITDKTDEIIGGMNNLTTQTKRLLIPAYLVATGLIGNVSVQLARWLLG